MSGIITILSKDSLCIKLFFLFYFVMAAIFYLSLEKVKLFKEIANPSLIILFFISVGIEVVFFLLMLIELFINPQTHELTSFAGLILGLVLSFSWMMIVYAYFSIYSPWFEKGIGFFLCMFIPAFGSFVCYIILIFIAMIKSLIY
jgi:hypothetical protein